MKASFLKPVKYMITTGATFCIEFLLLWLFTEYFHIYYLRSAILAFIITVTFGYSINRVFVFKNTRRSHIEGYVYFFLICLGALGIVLIGMYVFVDIFHIHYLLARVVLTIFTFLWTYSINHFFNFR